MITIISLNAAFALDVHLRPGRLNRDQRAKSIGSFVACKAVNAFRTIEALEPARHRLVISLGGHTGGLIARELNRERLPFDTAAAAEENRQTVVVNQTPNRQVEWKGKRHMGIEGLKALCESTTRGLTKGDIVLVSGSLPKVNPFSEWRSLFNDIEETGARLIIDSANFPDLLRIGVNPWVLKINREEWGKWTGKVRSQKTSMASARKLVEERGLRSVVVTDGPRGSWAVTSDKSYVVKPPARKTGWAVGCGDAFAGGLSVALSNGKDCEEALRIATICADLNLRNPVPGHIDLGGRDGAVNLKRRERWVHVRKVVLPGSA